MVPSNGWARFKSFELSLEPGADVQVDSESKYRRKFRACFARPQDRNTDASTAAYDASLQKAVLHIPTGVIPRGADDLLLEWTPDGGDPSEWNVDQILQPISIGGRTLSRRLMISRRVRGLDSG